MHTRLIYQLFRPNCYRYPNAGGRIQDANDASETQRVMTVLTEEVAQAAQLLVLVVDHFGKNVDTGTRNSSVKEDAVDAVLDCLPSAT